MLIADLNRVIEELSDFYERKTAPKTKTVELWYRLVKQIPAEPLKWITRHIQDNYESFPKNITSALWGSFTEWQQTNPDKKVIETFFECSDCNEGLIFAKKKNKQGTNYEYIFRCTKCKQNHCRAYPASSRLELLQDYEVISKEGNLSWGHHKSLEALTKSIGKRL